MSDQSACYYARVIGGKAKILNREGFDRLIQRMDGLEIDILIRKHRKARTLPQNQLPLVCKYLHSRACRWAHERHNPHGAWAIIPDRSQWLAAGCQEYRRYVHRGTQRVS